MTVTPPILAWEPAAGATVVGLTVASLAIARVQRSLSALHTRRRWGHGRIRSRQSLGWRMSGRLRVGASHPAILWIGPIDCWMGRRNVDEAWHGAKVDLACLGVVGWAMWQACLVVEIAAWGAGWFFRPVPATLSPVPRWRGSVRIKACWLAFLPTSPDDDAR